MSFWPFNAQNVNSTTNLNRLLDIYYQYRIIPGPSTQTSSNNTAAAAVNTSTQPTTSQALSPLANEIYNSRSIVKEEEEEAYHDVDIGDGEDELDSNTLTLSAPAAGAGADAETGEYLDTPQDNLDVSVSVGSSSSNSEYFEAKEHIAEDSESVVKIDREFVFEVLDDVSLLGELNNQNNRVIDFLCFGYINEQHPATTTATAAATTKETEETEQRRAEGNTETNDINDNEHNDTLNDADELDEDGDVKTINEEITTLKSNNSNIRTKQTQPNGISILEVLVDIIVDSIEWFDENEAFLFRGNNASATVTATANPNANATNSTMGDTPDEQEEDDEEAARKDQEKQEQVTATFSRIHVASEILSSKIWLISESLVEEQTLLMKLWSFLHKKTKDSSPAIQYFIKINEQLLDSRPDQMLNFIRLQSNLVNDFLKHIDITIIMDFLLRIITTDKVDIPTGIIDLLCDQKLVPKLLDLLLAEDLDASTQSSTGDFLKALISISANTSIDENTIGPNLLTKELVSETNVLKMIQIIKNRGNGLSTIVGVIIEIIRKNNSDYDAVNLLYTSLESHPPSKRDAIYLGTLLRLFSESLGDFNDILTDSGLCSKRYLNQIQTEFEPLGFERFKVCELIAELLHCSNIALLNNDLTEGILREREAMLGSQEDNLAHALNDVLQNGDSGSDKDSGAAPNKTSGFLNIPGKTPIISTAEPSVALTADNVTISPKHTPIESHDGFLPLPELSEPKQTEDQDDLKPVVVGDVFKSQLIKSGILKTIISMFVKFPWNNFWHNVVFDIVQQIFNGKLDSGFNPYLILELFSTCDITNLIIDSYKLCQDTEQTQGFRLGYMGHLVLIAEEVVKFSTQFHSIPFANQTTEQLIYDKLTDQNWINYVTNVLAEIREQYNCVLGGIKGEFQQADHLNKNAIVLGNSEEEILNQPIGEADDEEENGEKDQ
ncbi:hypothetical protein WICPIJ_009784 [Wickerhamomyces pijperi]|uniref:Uncharacterized protein n=1 Tax=Wickerhamomyces pijperi TaxID=599730 RepID=A0A9P8TBV1_WICPI|nr:hypothetical protein WICPIJ_009784 [Wickerhamomyces pijperi]